MNSQVLRTVFLSCLSGFVDTAVFILMGGLFVAHVTGNFVLLGATLAGQAVGGGHASATARQLAAFPLFIVSAGAATVLAQAVARGREATALLFVLSGGVFALVGGLSWSGHAIPVAGSMLLVVAMGALNAAHRLDQTLGPPFTVMTGNITSLAVGVVRLVGAKRGAGAGASSAMVWGPLCTVLGFLAGCAAGALAASRLGFGSMIGPALLMAGALIAHHRATAGGPVL
ncbi:MAG: DUF1275 domain-containing protein [Telmatospirillum sp.]|nr:DUF1275 domain-containing protein [Telmatospirillum sp.]